MPIKAQLSGINQDKQTFLALVGTCKGEVLVNDMP